MKSEFKKITMSFSLGALLMGTSAFAALEFTPPEVLSSDGIVTGEGAAFKTKLVRMGNGMLVSVFGDSIEGSDAVVYDLKADDVHKVRDIFVRTCMPTDLNGHCTSQSDWSEAVNISNTAHLSSASSKWERDINGVLSTTSTVFPGDSEKPNIFNAGTFAVVTWTDKYCPGGEQRIVSYLEREGLEVPFSCVYEAHANLAQTPVVWTTNQITSGKRDAKQDVNKGVSSLDKKGQWVITWQEDPQGLLIGGGGGPGEGASGASVSHGTDIWYVYTEDLMASDFSDPARLTNNMTHISDAGNANPVYENNGTIVSSLESGIAGASRANTAVVAITTGETVPTALVTYEETKGTGGLDDGKYVRYHHFPFNAPDTNATGEIISKEDENSRRVRFVTQVKPSADGMRMGIFWRQGNPTEGGPGDIMVRLGFKNSADVNSNGLRPEDMTNAVNISSNTIPWSPLGGAIEAPTNELDDATDKNDNEDARAHRAVIRGDDFYIGYSYAKDWALATYTDLDNYNFWMRRYDATTNSWTVAKNLSNIPVERKEHVKEPRLVGMPGNGAGCLTPADPDSITNPENCQDKSTLLVAWGVESNAYEHIGGAIEGDIYYTRTNDKGETFNGISVVDGIETSNRFESQLRSTPAGNIVYTVWNEKNNDVGGEYSMLSVSTSDDGTEGIVYPPSGDDDSNDTVTICPTCSDGGGCTYNPNSKSFDMMFLLMMALGLLYPFRRRFLK